MESTTTEEVLEKVSFYLPSGLRARLKKAASERGTSENATAVKLLGKGLDWYENLSDELREAS